MTQYLNDPEVAELKEKNEKPVQNSLGQDNSKDQDIVEALQYYLRERALTQNVHLPRWASW